MDDTPISVTGRCLCGGVAFTVAQARPTAVFCHCSLCRAFTGHYWASTRAELADITFLSDATLRWYSATDTARRGFCGTCGASLFFQPTGASHLGIAAGCLDAPTGLSPMKHIFTADAGDYYTIPKDAPHVPD